MSKRYSRLCLTLTALALAAVLCCPAALAAAPGQTARTQAAASATVSSAAASGAVSSDVASDAASEAASEAAPAPDADRAQTADRTPAAASEEAPAPDSDRAPAAAASSGGAGLALSVAALLVSALSVTASVVLVAVCNRSQNAADRKTLQALKELQQKVQAMEEQMAQLTRQPLTDPLAAPAAAPARTPAAQPAKPILAHAAPVQPAAAQTAYTAPAQTAQPTYTDASQGAPVHPAAAQAAYTAPANTAQPTYTDASPAAPVQPAQPAYTAPAAPAAPPAPAPLALYIVGRENVADNTTGLPYYAAQPSDPKIRVYDDHTARLDRADYQNTFPRAVNLVQKGFLAVFDVYVNGQLITGRNAASFTGFLQLERMDTPARLDPAAMRDGQQAVVLQKGVTRWKTGR